MKKRTLSNIFTSICVTSFFIMIFILIMGFLYDNLYEKAVLSNVNDYIQSQNMEEGIKEDLKSFEDENGIVTYTTRNIEMVFMAKSIVYEDMMSGIIASIILGSIIGILRTLMESRQDKKTVVKKAVLIYFAGLILTGAAVIIVNNIREVFEIENLELYSLLYTVVFIVFILSKLVIDNKKKRKLNELVKNYKDMNN